MTELNPYIYNATFGGSDIRLMNREANALKAKDPDARVFNLTIGNPSVPPPKLYKETLARLAAEDKPMVHGYGENIGLAEANEKFAQIFAKLQEAPVTADHVCCTSGCAGAINVFLRCILSQGDEVIVVSPYFLEYPFYIQNYGGVMRTFPTKFEEGWQLNADELIKYVNPMTRCLIINSPHNPTGSILTQETVNKMCAVLEAKSKEYGRPIWVCSDDVYTRVVAPGAKVHQIFNHYTHSVIAYSLSKDLSIPGERIGCLVVNPKLSDVPRFIKAIGIANEYMGFVHSNMLQMRVAAACLPEAISDLELYNESRRIICEVLDQNKIQYVKPEGAFYVFPKIPDGIEEMAFCKTMAANGVVVVPGRGFGAPGFYRISFCMPPERIRELPPFFKKAYEAATKK